jgi:hypothetical protein
VWSDASHRSAERRVRACDELLLVDVDDDVVVTLDIEAPKRYVTQDVGT